MIFSPSYFFLNYTSLFACLVPLFTGVIFYRRSNEVTAPFLFFFYGVVFSESFSYLLSRHSINNAWWNNIANLIETIFFCWQFSKWLNMKLSNWFLAGIIIFISFWIYTSFFVLKITQLNAYGRPVECLVVLCLAAATLISLTKKTAFPLFNNPKFWMASGAMIYFSFSVLVFGIMQLIAENNYLKSVYEPVWDIHSLMNIFSNLLYSIAFLCLVRTSMFHSRK